ncbi:MAG: NAD(P)/FAD-dependent oxidoreductase [Candidatus Eremiobacteraeota bacterium]|nr:NAD(P)/FAD-dependent oxidoreductase [Candidatus Eremiobacteraeota bacterium]
MSRRTIIVIGGGPSGLMAALQASGKNHKVILLDKMEGLGTKLAITGKGRCNLTHQVDRHEELIESFPGGGNFLHSAFNQFPPSELIKFFKSRGLDTKVEKGRRVFPVTDSAKDVLAVLEKELKKAGVETRVSIPVIEILVDNKRVMGVRASTGESFGADKVIIATGGMTYPWTGSTGDGYQFARRLGHSLVTPRPSLVPLEVAESSISHNLEGLSLKNIKAIVKSGNKVVDQKFGEMVFTSYGLSGPIILYLSRKIVLLLADKKHTVSLSFDLKPALSKDKLQARLESDFEKNRKKYFKNAIEELLPQKMIPVFIQESGIHPSRQCAQIGSKDRDRVIDMLKNFSFTITKARGMSEAEVTQGGVELKEVDPKTMESKLIHGLYFAGEVLDIDGYIGGFNLQAAFSTGYVAGRNASL